MSEHHYEPGHADPASCVICRGGVTCPAHDIVKLVGERAEARRQSAQTRSLLEEMLARARVKRKWFAARAVKGDGNPDRWTALVMIDALDEVTGGIQARLQSVVDGEWSIS